MEYTLPFIAEEVHDIVEWELVFLHRTAQYLSFEKEANPIPRQATEADRLLGQVAFEMWARSHHDSPPTA